MEERTILRRYTDEYGREICVYAPAERVALPLWLGPRHKLSMRREKKHIQKAVLKSGTARVYNVNRECIHKDKNADKYQHVIYFDGGCERNPGYSGRGGIYSKTANISLGEYVPNKVTEQITSNCAEWHGFYMAITAMSKVEGLESLLVLGDSKMVVMQVNKRWRINDDKPYYRYAMKGLMALKALEAKGVFVECLWVPREKNAMADANT